MKKIQLLIILPAAMAFLALMDYLFTQPEMSLSDQTMVNEVTSSLPTVPEPLNLTKATLGSNEKLSSYTLEKTTRSLNLFETFDLKQLKLEAYKNSLTDSSDLNSPLTIYELQIPLGQGGPAFAALKLSMTNQLPSDAELNATNSYGKNSLFYNPQSNPTTGFLLVQINDTLFGFLYPKASSKAFQFVQDFIEAAKTTPL